MKREKNMATYLTYPLRTMTNRVAKFTINTERNFIKNDI